MFRDLDPDNIPKLAEFAPEERHAALDAVLLEHFGRSYFLARVAEESGRRRRVGLPGRHRAMRSPSGQSAFSDAQPVTADSTARFAGGEKRGLITGDPRFAECGRAGCRCSGSDSSTVPRRSPRGRRRNTPFCLWKARLNPGSIDRSTEFGAAGAEPDGSLRGGAGLLSIVDFGGEGEDLSALGGLGRRKALERGGEDFAGAVGVVESEAEAGD